MGTNFYWKIPPPPPIRLPTGEVVAPPDYYGDDDDPRIHIGKRSAAGLFCWDCSVTLCRGGNDAIHRHDEMLKECPQCGGEVPDFNSLERGCVAVELGFAKPSVEPPKGVFTASSFSWAQEPEPVRKACERYAEKAVIVDEYGRDISGEEFMVMLNCNCPIEFMHIGERFS